MQQIEQYHRETLAAYKTLVDEGDGFIVYPSIGQVATAIGRSKQCVHVHVKFLVENGLLEKVGYGKYRVKEVE